MPGHGAPPSVKHEGRIDRAVTSEKWLLGLASVQVADSSIPCAALTDWRGTIDSERGNGGFPSGCARLCCPGAQYFLHVTPHFAIRERL